MGKQVQIMLMSGVEDGRLIQFTQGRDGYADEDSWTLRIGRRDDNDLPLRQDTFVSRQHANLHWKNNLWWLEDCNSTNGTYLGNTSDYFNDERVKGIVSLQVGQFFRIGRTWLRLHE